MSCQKCKYYYYKPVGHSDDVGWIGPFIDKYSMRQHAADADHDVYLVRDRVKQLRVWKNRW